MLTSSRAIIAALAALALIGALPARAATLAKVDGVEITDADLKIAADELGPGLPPELDAKARETYVLDYLIDVLLVAKKAEADKLGDSPEFQRQMAFARQKALMEAEMTKVSAGAVTDAAIQQTYDQAAKNQKPVEEIHARHILVDTEEQAKAALARVKGGEDFIKVAIDVSKDPGSPGGDLGFFTRDKMVPEFADAAFKMEAGQISEPVKSQFGWHIIKVEEKRVKPFPALEQVKDQVAKYVLQKAQSDMIVKLRGEAKIERTQPAPAEAAPKP